MIQSSKSYISTETYDSNKIRLFNVSVCVNSIYSSKGKWYSNIGLSTRSWAQVIPGSPNHDIERIQSKTQPSE